MNDRSATILLVDDEEALRQVLRARLTARGFSVHEASTGEEVFQTVSVLRPDVIVLDIGLPGIDGIEVTRRLRTLAQTPILILSVHAAESDKIAALDAGADDYRTKPCDLKELLSRIRTFQLRRRYQQTQVFSAGDLVVDLNRKNVRVADSPIQLTTTEYALLEVLIRNAGRLLTQRRLAQAVWGRGSDNNALQLLRTTISTLRKKLESNASGRPHIATETGVGYRFQIAPLS